MNDSKLDKAKETIVYVAEKAKDVDSFLEYLAEKLKNQNKNYKLDLKNVLLETDNYTIVGKSFYCGKLGIGYGDFEYLTVSSNLTKNDKDYRDKLPLREKSYFDEILYHTRTWTKEISELEIFYLLGLV